MKTGTRTIRSRFHDDETVDLKKHVCGTIYGKMKSPYVCIVIISLIAPIMNYERKEIRQKKTAC